ncbi:hypothetical protein [uncultured Limimaricola sp.]|uniref:hypothetical protein n=1 Tax=uncultured Limimaricola sp. TaxID=2211667 RepID=UPI0030F9A59C
MRYVEASNRYQAQAKQRVDRECRDSLTPDGMRGCILEILESTEDQKRSERDLDAQEAMSRFTRLMVFTGLLSLILGICSIYLIWATLKATQTMAEDTRGIGRAQARAYLAIDEMRVRLIDGPTDEGTYEFAIFTRVKNSGQSPAISVSVKAAGNAGKLSDVSSLNIGDVGSGVKECAIHTHTEHVTSRYVQSDRSIAGLYVSVEAQYLDVFGAPDTISGKFFADCPLDVGQEVAMRRSNTRTYTIISRPIDEA